MAQLGVDRNMIQQNYYGRFNQIPASSLQNDLYVGISEPGLKALTQTDGKNIVIGLKRISKTSPGFDHRDIELYVTAQSLTLPTEVSSFPPISIQEENNIILHCTRAFLEHYNFTEDDLVCVRSVKTFQLQKVIFGVKTEQAFAWASRHFFSTGLLLSVCQEKVLVRKDDRFLAPQNAVFSKDEDYNPSLLSDLYVVDCEPLKQGTLGINSKIVLLKLYDNQSVDDHFKQSSTTSTPRNLELLVSRFAKNLKTINLKTGFDKIDKNQQAAFKPKVVYKFTDWLEYVGRSYPHDPLATVVINTTTAKSVGVFDGGLMDIRLCHRIKQNQTLTRSKTSRTVIVKVVKDGLVRAPFLYGYHGNESHDVGDDTVMIPSPLMFHLKSQATLVKDCDFMLEFEMFPPSAATVPLATGLSTSHSDDVPYARDVHLALIHSPYNHVAKSYDGAIKNYFTQARCLAMGDVISIPTAGDPGFLPNIQDTYEIRYPVLYFKVTRLEPQLPPWTIYRVDSDHSALTLAGLAHSYVPKCASRFWSQQPCSQMWQMANPAGFDQHINSLTQWIIPYIDKRELRSEQMFPTILLEGVSGVGKTVLINAVAAHLNMHVVQIPCTDLCGESSAATEARIRNAIQKAASYLPCIVQLRDIHVLGKDRDGSSEDTRVSSCFKTILQVVFCTITDWPMVVIATTKSATHVSREIRDCFLRELKLEPPDVGQRLGMIKSLLDLDECSPTLDEGHIAQRTAGLVLGDLSALMSHARRVAYRRILDECSGGRPLSMSEERDICAAGVSLLQSDVETALDQLQSAHSDALGAPKIPDVSWEDVGGLSEVKADILDTIQLPLEHPELFAAGLRRSGVLLYGPPGTGKTLLAKAVATECSLNFLSVKGPELINMYVGQSEENVREVFHRARSASPCVIFFDELDSLAPNRGRSGDSGGVMDRVVSQLLAELDGLHKSCDIFVIGATNRPDLLDPALLRPGRFDKLLYLGVSEDKQAQLKIVKALTRKFHLSKDCSLEYILESCPGNLTGADFYALCSDAMLNAMKRKIQLLEAGENVDQSRLDVDNEDFLEALRNLVPSVSRDEMERYRDIQASFKNGR